MAGSLTFFFIAIGSMEPRDYRVGFSMQKGGSQSLDRLPPFMRRLLEAPVPQAFPFLHPKGDKLPLLFPRLLLLVYCQPDRTIGGSGRGCDI